MTTAATIDAHAGWPVLVVTKIGEPQSPKSYATQRVEPYTQTTVYLHSGCSIVDIIECTESYAARPPEAA